MPSSAEQATDNEDANIAASRRELVVTLIVPIPFGQGAPGASVPVRLIWQKSREKPVADTIKHSTDQYPMQWQVSVALCPFPVCGGGAGDSLAKPLRRKE